ncbi:MAG: serine/threonine-protein kinase [Gemmatimonadota bacterium]
MIAKRYEIIRPIGQGSFGRTFLGRDREANRDVALKILDKRADVDLKSLELFEREAAVLRSTRHHGIPEVFDLLRDEWEGVPASILVMEYVEGESLAAMIDANRQHDPAEVMHLFLEMLGILEYLHGRVPPVVHRDIKPSNIIVRPNGQPALVDFGSVRRVFLEADEAGSTIVGTYGYMPYEQYMGQATPSSDLYSLAATFLQLLTGRPPREFMSGEGRIQIPENLPGDPRLGPILVKLLKPSPAERYASARDVRQALLAPASPTLTGSSNVLRSSSRVAMRSAVDLSSLGPVPRPMDKTNRALLDRLSPSALELMDADAKPGDEPGLMDWLTVAFFSVLTVGILPVVFSSMARARRRRMRRFLREGFPVVGDILNIEQESIAFEGKISKVAYQFEADGEVHRDVDKILPVIANRWQPGDRIQVLYIAELGYDSVIVAAR